MRAVLDAPVTANGVGNRLRAHVFPWYAGYRERELDFTERYAVERGTCASDEQHLLRRGKTW